MKNKKIQSIVIILVLLIYTHFSLPKLIDAGVASCYQGITNLIDDFFLILSGVFIILSILSKNNKIAKVLGVVSIGFWLFWSFIIVISEGLLLLIHVLPLLITLVVIVKRNISNITNR